MRESVRKAPLGWVPTSRLGAIGCAALLLAVCPTRAGAQTFEAVGTRAQGMAGAFVAVADDATATWWNPAGLATGAYASAVVESGHRDDPAVVPASGPATRQTVTGGATTFPAFGVSYYHLHVSTLAPAPTVAGSSDRQDQQATVSLRSASYAAVGVTFGQSIGDHLVIGSTVSVLHGGATAVAGSGNGEAALSQAADLPVASETHGDLDLGAMAAFGAVRFGLNVKHVGEPGFGSGDARVVLTRQARAGVAVTGHPRGTTSALTLAVDADLNRTATARGDVRHLAAGLEAWLFTNRVGLRGGLSRNTIATARLMASTGASLALRRGVFVDGAWTHGSDGSERGWAVALRMTY